MVISRTATAIEHLLCEQIAAGSCEEFRELASEVIYGGSRVEIGGGRWSGVLAWFAPPRLLRRLAR